MYQIKKSKDCISNSFCSINGSNLTDINKFKTCKNFSKINAKSFKLLSSGVSKTVIKSNLTLVNSSYGDLSLDDPAIYLTLDLIGREKKVLYYSFSTPDEEIVGKLILALSGLNELMLKKGALIEDKEAKNMFEKACSIIYGSNFKIVKGTILNSLWLELKKLKDKNNLDVLIIDYIEALGMNVENQKENYQELLEHFNEMSLNIEIPIVVISRK